MTLVELNKIEQVLKENCDVKTRARKLFIERMREKYCENDGCWFESKMNDTEKETYEELRNEYHEAYKVYRSFIEHNWQ